MYGNYSKHHANQAYDIDFIRHSQGKRLMYRVVLIDLLNVILKPPAVLLPLIPPLKWD